MSAAISPRRSAISCVRRVASSVASSMTRHMTWLSCASCASLRLGEARRAGEPVLLTWALIQLSSGSAFTVHTAVTAAAASAASFWATNFASAAASSAATLAAAAALASAAAFSAAALASAASFSAAAFASALVCGAWRATLPR